MPATAPPHPTPDVARAAWWALPLPLHAGDIHKEQRPHMAALAEFAAALALLEVSQETSLEERLGQLDMLELALSGAFGPAMAHPHLQPAVVLRNSLLKTGGSFQDMLALADACRDMLKGDWPDDPQHLRQHAARASAPVLRHFLLLHGERDATLLQDADKLACAWFFLRLRAARAACPDANLPSVAHGMVETALQESAELWRRADDPHARALLWRLQRLGMAVARRLADDRPLLKPTGHASTLPPAAALPAALPRLFRAMLAVRAKLMQIRHSAS